MLLPSVLFRADIAKLTDPQCKRWALSAIAIERQEDGTPVAVVTDGKCLLAVYWNEQDECSHPMGKPHDPAEGGFKALVPAKHWGEIGNLIPKKSKARGFLPAVLENVVLDEKIGDDCRASFSGSDLEAYRTLSVALQEGRFPNWTELLKTNFDDGNSVTVVLDPEILIKLLTPFAKGLAQEDRNFSGQLKGQRVSITVSLSQPNRAIEIKADNDAEGTRSVGLICGYAPKENKNDEAVRRCFMEWLHENHPQMANALSTVSLTAGQLIRIAERLGWKPEEDEGEGAEM